MAAKVRLFSNHQVLIDVVYVAVNRCTEYAPRVQNWALQVSTVTRVLRIGLREMLFDDFRTVSVGLEAQRRGGLVKLFAVGRVSHEWQAHLILIFPSPC